MRAFRATPHTVTGETANFLMMGRELRLPDQITCHPPLPDQLPVHAYAQALKERLEEVHHTLREEQTQIRTDEGEEPTTFAPGDQVWLLNRRRRKGENPKLQPKFVGPFEIEEAYHNHTYLIMRHGQRSVQNGCNLKPYYPCTDPRGQAPAALEPNRRPNMRGATRKKRRPREPVETEYFPPPTLPEFPQINRPVPMEEDPVGLPEPPPAATRPLPQTPDPTPHLPTEAPMTNPRSRPQRNVGPPTRYGEAYCHLICAGEDSDQQYQENFPALPSPDPAKRLAFPRPTCLDPANSLVKMSVRHHA